MNLVLDLFTKKEIMIIGVVIGSLILIVLIMTLIDVISKRKKENKELDDAFEKFNEEDYEPIKIESSIKEEKVVENKIEVSENIEVNEVVKEKVQEIKEDVQVQPSKTTYIEPIIIDIDEEEKVQVNNTNVEIEPIMENKVEVQVQEINEIDARKQAQIELEKIEKSLENPKSLEDTLYDLEIEEEENAIISYQELLENTKELNVVNVDSGDEIISLKEIVNLYEVNETVTEDIEVDVKKEMTKVSINDAYKGDFTSTPFLSPIMGFESDTSSDVKESLAKIQLENTANLEKLDKELRKTNEFLKVLNELKKNLD